MNSLFKEFLLWWKSLLAIKSSPPPQVFSNTEERYQGENEAEYDMKILSAA